MQDQVVAAMREAGVRTGEGVMLTGHSQGGITAASLASSAQFRNEFTVQTVVTGGSPVARFDIPDSVSVLSLEHDQDAVPMLEGRENPDRANWVTVERDLSPAPMVVPDAATPSGSRTLAPGPMGAHDTDIYSQTGALVDESTDPSVRAWLDQQDRFFAPGGTTTRWDVTSR